MHRTPRFPFLVGPPGHTHALSCCLRTTLLGLILASSIAAPLGAQASEDSGASEPSRASNVVYGELLGSGGGMSLNYERLLGSDWAVRVGLSLIGARGSTGEPTTLYFGMPILVEYFGVGTLRHHLELGVGVTPVVTVNNRYGSVPPVIGAAVLGYRYQDPAGGFMMRAGFTPLFGGDDFSSHLWPGLSLGINF